MSSSISSKDIIKGLRLGDRDYDMKGPKESLGNGS
jgi:hypothetical protein